VNRRLIAGVMLISMTSAIAAQTPDARYPSNNASIPPTPAPIEFRPPQTNAPQSRPSIPSPDERGSSTRGTLPGPALTAPQAPTYHLHRQRHPNFPQYSPSVAPFYPRSSALPSGAQPSEVLDTIHRDLEATVNREAEHFSTIREGLESLRETNELLRTQAKEEQLRITEEQRRAETERQRAQRAERLAQEAQRSAEHAQQVAVDTLKRIEELELQNSKSQAAAKNDVDESGEEGLAELPRRPAFPLPTGDSVSLQEQPVAESQDPSLESIGLPSTPITNESVDREALANNLFGAGEYQLASQVYAQLVANPPDGSDVIWFHFQLASCHRNLRRFAQAEKHYRIVAGDKKSYLAPTARWWLSIIQHEKEIRARLNQWKGYLAQQEGSRHE
jgi:tetratricopeptide (TPR) repeat protein